MKTCSSKVDGPKNRNRENHRKRGEMERDEDITLIGMQMHMEKCQESQANKCSGWNLVFVAGE